MYNARKLKTIIWETGGVEEGPGFEIIFNKPIQIYIYKDLTCHVETICPHYIRDEELDEVDERGQYYGYICPRTIVAYNEGGHCTTVTCLDCIEDALKFGQTIETEG